MATMILIKYPLSRLDMLDKASALPPDRDIGLTDDGRKVAERIGECLNDRVQGNVFVWSGPARRCVEGAGVIAEKLGLRATAAVELDERRMPVVPGETTVGQFRSWQERAYLDPFRGAKEESAVSHRLRVAGWLSGRLAEMEEDECHVVVSHGAVIEHLHAALSWKPVGAMMASFVFCAPGRGHLWSTMELPDGRRVWCCLGGNIDVSDPVSWDTPWRGVKDLRSLAVNLAGDARFQSLAVSASGEADANPYYIR